MVTKRTAIAKAVDHPFNSVFPVRLHLRNDLHLARKVWHMTLGSVVVAIYALSGMSRSTGVMLLGSFLGLDLLLEVTRLNVPAFNEKVLRTIGVFMRKSEIHKMSGVPYYLAAAILAVGIFPKPIAILSLLYLAFGDPIASLFGIMYGDMSVRFRSGKSLIGTAAGVATCGLVTLIFLNMTHLSDAAAAILVIVGAFAGGLAEMLPLDIDDNFSIPIVSGFVLWLSFIVLGL